MTQIEGDDNDGFAKGKGDGTSTGAAGSNSNGGSGKPQNNNCGRLNGGGTSTKVNARSRGSEKNDGKDSSDADAATANRFIDKSPSTEKSCLHCGESLLHGQRVTLHECAVVNFTTICAREDLTTRSSRLATIAINKASSRKCPL